VVCKGTTIAGVTRQSVIDVLITQHIAGKRTDAAAVEQFIDMAIRHYCLGAQFQH